MNIWFLQAALPLVKSFHWDASTTTVTTTPYPLVKHFTSHKESIDTLVDFHKALAQHAQQGHCLIKGRLNRDLNKQDRKKATRGADPTQWLCLDLDGAPFTHPEDFMGSNPVFENVSYLVQWSASQGLGKPGLRCHIFVLLTAPINPHTLKAWLMSLNLDGTLYGGRVRSQLHLNEAATTLHWPIDPSCCQNDKLLYIAPPNVAEGVPYTPPKPAIKHVQKKHDALPIERIGFVKLDLWKTESRLIINELRKNEGLPALRPTAIQKGFEIQKGTGVIAVTDIFDDTGFVHLNLNGGDSRAYWHPKNNFEYIHNFKGEPSLLTQDSCPDYYRECVEQAQTAAQLPTAEGEIILGICDTRSGAYLKVAWNPAKKDLTLHPARSKDQLTDWLLQHNRAPGDFVPQWNVRFDPKNDDIIDLDGQTLNTFVPSTYQQQYVKAAKTSQPARFPCITSVITSIISGNVWTNTTDHFINWLAVIFQTREKTGTAWVTHGVEGTGKGFFVNKILRPLLGQNYVKEILITRLEDPYNSWIENTLMCFIDELQVSSSRMSKVIEGQLRNWITEPYLDIRPMHATAYNAENFTNFIIGSNQPDPVTIKEGDRRYNIGTYQPKEFFVSDAFVVQVEQELPLFFDYLMQYPIDIEKARKISRNDDHKKMALASRNSLDLLCDALKEGDIDPFIDILPDTGLLQGGGHHNLLALTYRNIIQREVQLILNTSCDKTGVCTVASKLSRDELFVLLEHGIGGLPESPYKFTRMLAHKGLVTKRMRQHAGELAYGIELTWKVSQEWQTQMQPIKKERPPLRKVN